MHRRKFIQLLSSLAALAVVPFSAAKAKKIEEKSKSFLSSGQLWIKRPSVDGSTSYVYLGEVKEVKITATVQREIIGTNKYIRSVKGEKYTGVVNFESDEIRTKTYPGEYPEKTLTKEEHEEMSL